jgi:hypothetical protein
MSPAHPEDSPTTLIDHTSPQTTNNNEAGRPIPEAILVYHESAHSIVFRDHLRRQLSAIRRTASDMSSHGASIHHGVANSSHHGSRHSSTHSVDSSEGGYKLDSSDVGYESTGSRESHGSFDKSEGKRHLFKKDKQKGNTPSSSHPVAVANFQPVIEPLERLELNASDEFGELLDADPLDDGLSLSEAEMEGMYFVIVLLLN